MMENSNMPLPMISVLMPIYNAELYVGEAIESILNQTYKNFEFIIIDDGSTDNSLNIIKSYKDDRIKLFQNDENKGLIYTLNRGLDLAQGKYIARMDSDDISLPKRFEIQVNFLEQNKNIGILGTGAKGFGVKSFIHSYNGRVSGIDLMKACVIFHPTVFLRKEFFDKFNLRYSVDYKACEDYELWTRAIRFMEIYNIPDILLNYRVHTSNISVTQSSQQNIKSEIIRKSLVDEFIQKIASTEQREMFEYFFNINKHQINTTLSFCGVNFLKIKNNSFEKKVYLFKIFKLLTIKNQKIYLFNILPIFKYSLK